MKCLLLFLALSVASLATARQAASDQFRGGNQNSAKKGAGVVTVKGCVGKFGEDYTLTRTNAEQTYERQGKKGIKLSLYLGQQVEATGALGPSPSTTAPNEASSGSASAVTLTLTSVKKLMDKCPAASI